MRIAVLGCRGMLGTDLVAVARERELDVVGFDLPEVDIASKSCSLDQLSGADVLINVAAYTAVDDAEDHEAEAFAVNCDGVRRVAQWCSDNNCKFVHLSTDYVFDGTSSEPYREDHPTSPVNAYGRSKLAGEAAARALCEDHLIVRTQSLFGKHGRNFAAAILSKLDGSDSPLRVVNDQTSCPTYTPHLADAILRLLETGKTGIVHVSAATACTWYDFAVAIAGRVKPGAVVEPVTSDQFKTLARRPRYSVLDKSIYCALTGRKMPSWEVGLVEYLESE